MVSGGRVKRYSIEATTLLISSKNIADRIINRISKEYVVPINQSVCLPILPPMNRRDLFAEVANIGYPAVEIWGRGGDFEDLSSDAARAGLKVVSMIGHESLPDGLNKRDNHDRIEKELRVSIDVASEFGVPSIICFSGNKIPGMENEEALQSTCDGFARVAPYAEKKGITLNLELLNSKVDHQGYQCDNTAWGVEVVKRVGSPRVKLLYDIYHMQIMEGDIIRTITDNIESIGHFHTAGNPGRNDLDTHQELNYAAICRAIATAGYEGYVGHEFRPKGEVVPALRHAFELCNV